MPSKRVPLTERKDLFYKNISVENISLIPINNIESDPNQPRRKFSEQSIEELASSIKEKGLLQPIIVRKEGDKHIIVAGERRWRACKAAGLDKIQCIVKEIKSKKEIKEIQIIENLQREDISQIERARAIREYIASVLEIPEDEVLKKVSFFRHEKCTEEEKIKLIRIFDMLGKVAYTIERWLVLLTLPEDIQEKIDSPDSIITARHIESIAKLKDEKLIRQVVELVEKEELSSEKTKEVVENIKSKDMSIGRYILKLSKDLNSFDKAISTVNIELNIEERKKLTKEIEQLEKIVLMIKEKLI